MDTADLQHMENIKQAKLKRLRVLELHQAEKGSDTSPHIITEIADLRTELSEIELKLSLSSKPYTSQQNFAIVKYRKLIEIEIKGSYSPKTLSATIRAIAAILNIQTNQIKLIQVFGVGKSYRIELPVDASGISPDIAKMIKSLGGNILYKVDLPTESAIQFYYLYEKQDTDVMDIGVEAVRFNSKLDNNKLISLGISSIESIGLTKIFVVIAFILLVLVIILLLLT